MNSIQRLNYRIAVELMDYKHITGVAFDLLDPTGLGRFYWEVPNYCTDIYFAWQVVNKMRDLGYFSSVTDLSLDSGKEDFAWHFINIKNSMQEGVGRGPAPWAICLGAMRAKGFNWQLEGLE